MVTPQAVKRILARWRPRLGLDSRWSILVRIYDGTGPLPDALTDCVAAIEPDPAYHQATLYIDGNRASADSDGLEAVVLHELVHIVAWPLSVLARDGLGSRHEETWRMVMEQHVEAITRALLPPARSRSR